MRAEGWYWSSNPDLSHLVVYCDHSGTQKFFFNVNSQSDKTKAQWIAETQDPVAWLKFLATDEKGPRPEPTENIPIAGDCDDSPHWWGEVVKGQTWTWAMDNNHFDHIGYSKQLIKQQTGSKSLGELIYDMLD